MNVSFHAVDTDAARYLLRMMADPRCCACRKTTSSGVISYGKVHEPHCEECCKAWESQMRFCASERYSVTLDYFRAWQAQRASAA